MDPAILIARDMAKAFEGFHRVTQWKPQVLAKPYLCPAGYWTIGYGSLCPKDHPWITEDEGEILLDRDLSVAMRQTLILCPGLIREHHERLAAVADFTFNLGAGRLKASTFRRRVNAREWGGAAEEVRKWVWGGGKKLPGLVARCEARANLLLLR